MRESCEESNVLFYGGEVEEHLVSGVRRLRQLVLVTVV